MATIMQNIEGERIRHGMTQEQLCSQLGINRVTYYKWKKTDNIPARTFLACTKIFNCGADYLTRDVDAGPVQCAN